MTTTMIVNEHERRVIVSGLKRLKNYLLQLQRRDQARGWQPKEGQQDVHALRLASVESVLARYDADYACNQNVQA